MLLLIDNYDSFTYNIVQYFEKLSQNVIVKRNDEISSKEIAELSPDYIVVGPGPCTPVQAGISIEVIKTFANKIPILGVCLGHQAIGEAFGGRIVRAQTIMHGKNSLIYHKNIGVFTGIKNPISCTRYHSLVISRDYLPHCLEVHAHTDDNEIMGVIHKTMPIEGVQFHPEALLSDFGYEMFNNFLTKYK